MKNALIGMMLIFGVNTSFAVIYEKDDRVEPHLSRNTLLKKLSESTVALMKIDKSIQLLANKNYKINSKTLGQRFNLCENERFYNQPSTESTCSGFLVAPDLVLTAGHCVERFGQGTNNELFCSTTLFVFDYKMDKDNTFNNIISEKKVYACEKVIVYLHGDNIDYALVKLNRKVNDRPFLKLRSSGKIQNNEKIAVIGYPSGLPLKITEETSYGNGAIENSLNPERKQFFSNIDVLKGNSGSPAFNLATGVVEGIFTNLYSTGYIPKDNTSSCTVPMVCELEDYCYNKVTKSIYSATFTNITDIPELAFILNAQKVSAEFLQPISPNQYQK